MRDDYYYISARKKRVMDSSPTWSVPRGNDRQWIEVRGDRQVTITEHPIRDERVEFFNEPDDPTTGTLTLRFHIGAGHGIPPHVHPEQTETLTVNQGRLRVEIGDEERVLEVGDHERVPPGVVHSYDVVGDEAVILTATVTPALEFKEFVVAEHALEPSQYPEDGMNLPYYTVVTKAHGPMIAPPNTGIIQTVFGLVLSVIARVRRLAVPDEPLPVREADESA